ncbi:MAG: trypsin-like peptidase domain-containing protein [Stellaceae bacterium]
MLSRKTFRHLGLGLLLVAAMTCGLAAEACADYAAGVRYAKQGDYLAARREYLAAATDGNASAQNNLASLYRSGEGGPIDLERAFYWFSKAALQGQVNAQTSLGDMYEKGDGVPRDYLRAAYWYRRAAVAGFFIGQSSLAEMFEIGRGIPREPVTALAWYTIAAKARVNPNSTFYTDALRKAVAARDRLAQHLSTAERVAAEDIARHWVVGFDLPAPSGPASAAAPTQPATAPSQQKKTEPAIGTGTGFIVNDRGDVVTNSHVAGRCSRLSFALNGQPLVTGRLIAVDGKNDLAVVNFPLPGAATAVLSDAAKERLGEDLLVFGYPLIGILSTSGNLTRGSISALDGIDDDARYIQISAPVQPGNSGGPVMDAAGRVIGVVTYKLDALTAVKASGDIPQNVNFALKVSVLRLFLDSHSIPYRVPDPSSGGPAAGEVGDAIQKFTGVVVCAR